MTNQLPCPDLRHYFPESKEAPAASISFFSASCEEIRVRVTHARAARLLLLVSIKPHYKTSNYGLCRLRTALQSNGADDAGAALWLAVLFQKLAARCRLTQKVPRYKPVFILDFSRSRLVQLVVTKEKCVDFFFPLHTKKNQLCFMQQLTLCWGFLVIGEGIKTRLEEWGGVPHLCPL